MTVSVGGFSTAPERTAQFAALSARLKTSASTVPSDDGCQISPKRASRAEADGLIASVPVLCRTGTEDFSRASTLLFDTSPSARTISMTRTSSARIPMAHFGSILFRPLELFVMDRRAFRLRRSHYFSASARQGKAEQGK